MEKQNGVYQFKYTEWKNNNELESELTIDTKDVVHSIGKFGEGRQLINLSVKQINTIKRE